MTSWLLHLLQETWIILLEMAPYLVLGFFLAGLLAVTIKPDVIEKLLGRRTLSSVVKASLLGIPLPLCSCGVIPVTSSLYQRGASKGAATSFLTSTPQTGVDSIAATAGLINPWFAGVRVLVALLSGVAAGLLVDLFAKESRSNPGPEPSSVAPQPDQSSWSRKMMNAVSYGFFTLPQDIGKPLLLGILLAGLLGVILPENWGESYLGSPWLTYLAVTMIAIPLYVCSTGSIPIAFALLASGTTPGAALVFLIAGPATNAATVTTLLKILGRRTIAIYLVTIILIAWVSGWTMDYLGAGFNLGEVAHHSPDQRAGPVKLVSVIGLLAMMTWAFAFPLWQKYGFRKIQPSMRQTLLVEGMDCSHCAAQVRKALLGIPGIISADANAGQNLAWVEAEHLDVSAIQAAIAKAGYRFKGLRNP